MKNLLITLGSALLMATAVPAHAEPFLDTVGHPHASYVELLRDHGIVQGYGYNLYRPDILLNRAEFLKIVMLSVDGKDVSQVANTRCFLDFQGEEQWFWRYACVAKQRGIVNGYPDGTFRGEQHVNLAEALKMTMQAWNVQLPTVAPSAEKWYLPYFDEAAARRMLDFFPINPAHLLTRSEMAVLIVTLGEPIAYVNGSASSSASSSGPAVCGNGTVEPPEQCDDGNTEDGDGCSSICIEVSEPVRHAALRVEQLAVSNSAVTPGAKSVPLLAFMATAGRQSIRLTQLKFVVEEGNLNQASNYHLFVDVDGEAGAEVDVGAGTVENGVLTIRPVWFPVADGISLRAELRADIATSGSVGNLAVGFATTDVAYIQAVGEEDGRELTGIQTDDAPCTVSICWIAVYTLAPRSTPVSTDGSLFITSDASVASSKQLLLGEKSDTLLKLTLRAEKESVEVKNMNFQVNGSSISSLELLEPGTVQPLASAREGQCATSSTGTFCAALSLTVPSGGERTLLVRAVLKPDTEGGLSGEEITISLPASGTAVQARGVTSGRDTRQNNGDADDDGEIFIGRSSAGANIAVSSAVEDTVAAKMLAIENSHTDAEGTLVPTGNVTIGRFRFTSYPHRNSAGGFNDLTIQDLYFTVNASNVDIDPDTFALYNPLQSTTSLRCTSTGNTGNLTVSCTDINVRGIASRIAQGSTIELALRANVRSAKVQTGSSSLQVSLTQLNNRSQLGSLTWDDVLTRFTWVDISTSTVRSTGYRTP